MFESPNVVALSPNHDVYLSRTRKSLFGGGTRMSGEPLGPGQGEGERHETHLSFGLRVTTLGLSNIVGGVAEVYR